MGELNLLRPRPVTLLRRRRCILSCALLLVMLGIYGLWIERESVRAQLTDLQQLQAKRRLDQQQQQLQQAALQQRAEVVEQQRRIINVLRGVAMSKAASAHYTKVQWAEDGWSLHGQASNHKEVASIVSKLKAVITDQTVVAANVVAADNSPRVIYEIRLRRPLQAIGASGQ